MAELGLHCSTQAFSGSGEQGYPLAAVRGLLIEAASLVAEHGHSGLVVVAHRLICPEACGIFPDQGPNQRPLHCKADFNH